MSTKSYFTFPLKLLWVKDPKDYNNAIDHCIRFSVIKFMSTGNCGDGPMEDQFIQAREKLNFSGGIFDIMKRTATLVEKSVVKGDIYTSVRTTYLFDAREGKLKIDLLLLVAAIKSLIGPKRKFTKTYRLEIVRRMYGTSERLSRYRFDKLIAEGNAKRMFTVLSAGRGFYVSICYDLSELSDAVISRIMHYQEVKSDKGTAERSIQQYRRSYRTNGNRPDLED